MITPRARFHCIFVVLIAISVAVGLNRWRVEQIQAAYGTAVNLAGRQRMLSQRMIVDALRLGFGLADADASRRLQQAVEEFETSLQSLRLGLPAIGLPPERDALTVHQLKALEERWTSFKAAVQQVVAARPLDTLREQQAREVVAEGSLLLEAAERTVELVQRQGSARRALERSGWYERILLAVSVAAAGLAWILTLRTADEAVATERRFRELAESAAEGILLTDVAGAIRYANPAARRLFGYPEHALRGMAIARLLPGTALRPGSWEGEGVRADGQPILLQGSMSLMRSRSGSFHTYVVRDVTEQRRLEQRLAYLADHDPLTGLYNRRRFAEELERHLARVRRYGEAGALVLLDLDAFKDLNDMLGPRAGDEVLAAVAALLRMRLREPEIAARLGGDEFAVLLPRADPDGARAAASDLLESLRLHALEAGGQAFHISASAGLVCFPEHGSTADQLVARAEVSMQHAKRRGRNRLEVYRPELEAAVPQAAFAWEQRLRQALASDGLVLLAQPILDLRSRRVARCELLLRLPDERGELAAPGAFLGAAERAGLLGAIDRWVVQRAVRLIAEQARRGRPLCLEVNLSPNALTDAEFLQEVQATLAASRIPAGLLVLEITETAALADLQQARAFMRALRAQGCRFALDDFGVGFASFFYLKHLPVDSVKIDGAFIQNMERDPVNARIVKAIVEVARGLEIETVAEYVEDEATMQQLRELGVDYAQGYHVGRPLPVAEACRLAGKPVEGRRLPPLPLMG